MTHARLLVFVLAACGCSAPFTELPRGRGSQSDLDVAYCGSSTVSIGSVIKAMDGPPSATEGRGESSAPQVTVCMMLHNRGGKPARVDRSHVTLRAPREKQPWVPDSGDEVFVVPPGTSRRFEVSFAMTPLVSGEDVAVRLDDAITVEGRAAHLAPITLRRK